MSTEAIAYLITISSSSINSPVTHARLGCSLPYTWAILPHIQTDPTPIRVVVGSKPRASPSSNCSILHFYLGRPRTLQEQVHQQTPGRSHPHTKVHWNTDQGPLPYLGRSRMLQ